MGKRLLFLSSILIILASGSRLSIINAASDQIHVTATVLPSPEWLSLVQKHSTITRTGNTYTVKLTDGNILLKNQKIILSFRNIQYSAFTDSSGKARFHIAGTSNNFSTPAFNYFVMGTGTKLLFFPSISKYFFSTAAATSLGFPLKSLIFPPGISS